MHRMLVIILTKLNDKCRRWNSLNFVDTNDSFEYISSFCSAVDWCFHCFSENRKGREVERNVNKFTLRFYKLLCILSRLCWIFSWKSLNSKYQCQSNHVEPETNYKSYQCIAVVFSPLNCLTSLFNSRWSIIIFSEMNKILLTVT